MALENKGTSGCTHYEVLGVDESSNIDEIKAAFHRLAREHHPDRSQSPSPTSSSSIAYRRVQAAWECLRDSALRSKYDEMLLLERNRSDSRRHAALGISADDCREETILDDGDEAVVLIYTCRCGQDLDTSLADEHDLVECPGCCLTYDTAKLWTG